MTDKQIIEALECCITQDGTIPCYSCPCWDYDDEKCKGLSYSDILSLIARQKAKIEKLEAELCEYPVKTVVGNNSMICSKTSEDYDNLIRDISNAVARDFIKANESCCQDLEIEK